jgi:uncharacterized protein
MNYLRIPEMEDYEQMALPLYFNKSYEPAGSVNIDRDTIIDLRDTKMTCVSNKILAMQPETAAWSFLSEAEATLLNNFSSVPFQFGTMIDNNGNSSELLSGFMEKLYRRGLVRLNNYSSTDSTVFNDSPNNFDGNLVELLLTEKCNLNCGYCLAGTNPNMPSMEESIAFKTIDKAFLMSEAKSITFEFSGGEPLMRFELLQRITAYIREHPLKGNRKVYIGAQTNATLLTETKVKWLKENDLFIGVSIDGNPETHNLSRPTVTGRESFTKVIRGILLLQQHAVPFGILVVLNSTNAASPDALIDFLLKYNLPVLKLNPIAFLGTAQSNWNKFGITNDEITAYFKKFSSLIVERGVNIVEDNLRTMMVYMMSKQRFNRCMRTHCGAGETFQAINAKGDIFPCGRSTQSPGLKIGNVADDEITSLSQAGLKNQFIQEIKARRPRDLEDCKSCFYQQLCQSGCAVQSYEKYGTVRHKTPECSFYKTMYPYLMHWLTFDDKARSHFNQTGYFNSGIESFSYNYLN